MPKRIELDMQLLRGALPQLRADRAVLFLAPLRECMEEFEIDANAQRAAMFLAQTAHESAHFFRLVENLNYSAARLLQVFPKYFTPEEAAVYERKPSSIAARVYANRMGNGNEASADGWVFRGRGLLQLTGRKNYRDCGRALCLDLENNPSLLQEPDIACRSAGWFWQQNDLNELCDAGDVRGVTRRINGGTHGLEERASLYAHALSVLTGEDK